jgi:hypothetical protein
MEDLTRHPRYEEARRRWGTLGWGIGLLAHGVSVFAFDGWLGSEWEERKIREYLDRRA